MGHAIDRKDGKDSFAFTGSRQGIWHRLGQEVGNDITPAEMMKQAGADWEVLKYRNFVTLPLLDDKGQPIKGKTKKVETDRFSLVRSDTQALLDTVSEDWQITQNSEAFQFFDDFVKAGDMEMNTGGVLHGGRIVFANAMIKKSFGLFGNKDEVQGYLLFCLPHQFGQSTTVKVVAERVVCANTLAVAMGERSKNFFRITHRIKFDPDVAKLAVGIAADKIEAYKAQAEHLGGVKAKKEDVVEFFKRLLPVYNYKKDEDHQVKKDVSKKAQVCLDSMDTQPGAEFGRGTWWQAFNAFTYNVDHTFGNDADNRRTNAWLGQGADSKIKALNLAMEMAK